MERSQCSVHVHIRQPHSVKGSPPLIYKRLRCMWEGLKALHPDDIGVLVNAHMTLARIPVDPGMVRLRYHQCEQYQRPAVTVRILNSPVIPPKLRACSPTPAPITSMD